MPPKAILGEGGSNMWIGLIVDPEHGWKWTNGMPYRYMNWDSGKFDPLLLAFLPKYITIETHLQHITSNNYHHIILLNSVQRSYVLNST